MAGPSDGTVTPQRPPPQKQPSSSSTSSPGLLCSASTSYKKKPGTLTLTKKALTWSPSTPGQAEELVINGSRLNCPSLRPSTSIPTLIVARQPCSRQRKVAQRS